MKHSVQLLVLILVLFTAASSWGDGIVSGVVTAISDSQTSTLLGAMVDIYDSDGFLVSSTTTPEDGSYEFADLPSGQGYTVTIVTPLGYEAGAVEIPVTVVAGEIVTADFDLASLETFGKPRGIGYWKHEIGVSLGGAGSGELTRDALCGYLDLIEVHFNSNEINQVLLYEPPESDICTDKLIVAMLLLNLVGDEGLHTSAKQSLIALLFNVAAGNIFQQDVISRDGATVSQAITFCDNVIDDPEGDYNFVMDICNDLNHSRILDAGVIPMNTLNIVYKQLPLTFSLSQNYPNPFNPTTEISFSLPHASHVNLEVYNIRGQRISTLVDRQMEAGYHTVSFGGSQVSSGVYLYRLRAGEFAESRKMMLVK